MEVVIEFSTLFSENNVPMYPIKYIFVTMLRVHLIHILLIITTKLGSISFVAHFEGKLANCIEYEERKRREVGGALK